MKPIIFLTVCFLPLALWAQPEETAQQKSMAKQMASYMDQAWEASPEEGNANLRLLFKKDGQPFAGTVSIHGRFKIKLSGSRIHTTSFNPNKNGRYVYENLSPGQYHIVIQGVYEHEGFKWETKDMELKSGESPLIEIEL